MRLLAMDDPEFSNLEMFTAKQWNHIIKNCVDVADVKIQKIIEKTVNQPSVRLLPFKKRNKDEL